MRFFSEFLRADPGIIGFLKLYHILCVLGLISGIVQLVIVRITGISDFEITPKTRLDKKSANISSFTSIQLFCEIEDEFGVEIPNSAIKKMKTVKDLVEYLNKND